MKILEKSPTVEWPTIAIIASCYASWLGLVLYANMFQPIIWIMLCGIVLTFFWSIVHEVVHGHPTRNAMLNRLLILFPIGWVFPYERFRDTHIEHHETGELTDPLDDPESWYMFPDDWLGRSKFVQSIFQFNNTLFGRILIGPIISLTRFYNSEVSSVFSKTGDASKIVKSWTIHLLLCGLIILFLANFSTAEWWHHIAAAYIGVSFLLVRTFLEHQANENHEERTVIIEHCCPIAFLFLFNNLHFVHHAYPGVPWYQLPGFYKRNRDAFIAQNNGYVYRSYPQIFARYFFRMKEPVFHPCPVNSRVS